MTAPKTMPAALAIRLFGPMQVIVAGLPLPRLRSRKALSLLALLALRHGRLVEREWLAATIWPDAEEEQALGSLRAVLSELRQALGDQAARVQSPSRHALCLELDGVDVDVTAFDAAIKSKRLAALERAAALYQGPLLEGSIEEWVGQERTAREQDCLQALGTLADAALASGDDAASIGYYRRALGLDPWWEAARRGLMQALARRGDGNEAIRVYREFIDLLRDDPKAVPDPETSALYTRLREDARRLAGKPAGAPVMTTNAIAVPVVSGRLPHPLTDLIGREDERVEVRLRLRRSRLVTLTGPGGIGKTRLAVAVASESVRDFADGVCLVALDALSDKAQVAGQIAAALGLKEQAGRSALKTASDHMHEKRLLLVLDNCEHVLEECTRLAGHLLSECGALRILATSREALGIPGEAIWPVPSLAVPDPKHLPPGQSALVKVMLSYEGVQLFVDRAQAVNREFSLSAGNAQSAAQVCARLEGIPLAIELAAARVRVMSVNQIASRLDDYLGLLTGGSRVAQTRQQTLRSTLNWSYDLLREKERLLLLRLSVFAGGWDLTAAERVCAGEDIEASDILDLLTSLIDKSLVVFASPVAEEAEGRYRLLETVRQYGAERLNASGEANATKGRHGDYFLALAEAADPHLKGPEQAAWLPRLEADHDNLRAALSWLEATSEPINAEAPMRADAWLRLCLSLRWFWDVRGYLSEGRQWLKRALTRTESLPPSTLRARALHAAGDLAWNQGDYGAARALYEESLDRGREQGDDLCIANALNGLGSIALQQGDYGTAQAHYTESSGLMRRIGDPRGIAVALNGLGNVAYCQGEFGTARRFYTESLDLRRGLGDRQSIASSLNGLSNAAFKQGAYDAARALCEESLDLRRRIGDQRGIGIALNGLGNVTLQQGAYDSAWTLYEESLTLMRQIGDQVGIAVALNNLSTVASYQGDDATARTLLEEGLDLYRQIGDQRGIAWSLGSLGVIAHNQGDYAAARPLFVASLNQGRQVGDQSCIGWALGNLGNLTHDEGDAATARALLEEGLVLLRQIGDQAGGAEVLERLAAVAASEGDGLRGARIWGAASALREKIGRPIPPHERRRHELRWDLARASSGEAAFAAAWNEGRAWTWEQAVVYALEVYALDEGTTAEAISV